MLSSVAPELHAPPVEADEVCRALDIEDALRDGTPIGEAQVIVAAVLQVRAVRVRAAGVMTGAVDAGLLRAAHGGFVAADRRVRVWHADASTGLDGASVAGAAIGIALARHVAEASAALASPALSVPRASEV